MTDTKSGDVFSDEPPVKRSKPKKPVAKKTPKIPEPVAEEISDGHEERPVGNLIDLPSKGLLGYPSEISYREIMAGDEETLKTATNKNFSRTVNRVLKSICNDVEFFDDMYLGDRDFVLTWIWANTYNDEKRFDVTCRHCGEKEETNVNIFNLDDIPIKENFRKGFPVKINKTGDTLTVRLVTVRDENNSEKFLAENPKEEYSLELVQTALALDFGKPMKLVDRVNYFKNNVSAKERGIIQEYHRYFQFGLDTRFEHHCGECQGVTRGQIPFLPDDIIAPVIRTDFEQLLHDDEGSQGG